MNYRNSEMRIDQIVNYFNEVKINLSPPFQRGRVWSLPTRQKLLKNIVQGKPIPAIFLYKEAEGSRYSYNIMDGKQRLESLILFIGAQRDDIKISGWKAYFFTPRSRRDAQFKVQIGDKKITFRQLEDAMVREFQEYRIPTVEITLDDETTLDEIINLFVDINQQGVAVKRFDIVKALVKDPLLRDVFKLIAVKQQRRQDVYYKTQKNNFTHVLKRLQVVDKLPDQYSKVDRIWERLLEIILFSRSKEHRKPVEILKSFINSPQAESPPISVSELKRLKRPFAFLRKAYATTTLGQSRLATDQTHFYTMVTSLIGGELLKHYAERDLLKKLEAFGNIIQGKQRMPKEKRLHTDISKYVELSARQTTDVSRRRERQEKFISIISGL